MRSVVVVGADVGGMQNAFHAVVLGRAPAVLRPSSPLTPVRMYGLRRLAMGRMAMNAVAPSDGETHCSKFRSDEVQDGASCGAKH